MLCTGAMISRKQSDEIPLNLQSDKQDATKIDPLLTSGGSPLTFENEFGNFANFAFCTAKWIKEAHSKKEPKADYGKIKFYGFGNRTEISDYARVHCTLTPDYLWSLLSDTWHLKTPKLVLSIAGGARHFNMKPHLTNAFQQGLIDIASSTEAWIVTRGAANGVTKYVGDAVREHKLLTNSKQLVVIGIATWDCMANAHVEDPGNNNRVPEYSFRDCVEEYPPLDQNHTRFILVDDGTAKDTSKIYDTTMALRARLEEHIQKNYRNADSGGQTPVVLIVCEGGKGTLQQTADAISSNIPVVIIKGSGRAADIISEAYEITKPKHGYEKSTFLDDFQIKIAYLIDIMFDNPNQDIIHTAVGHLEIILSQRTLITIFEMSDISCRDLDKAVLTAALKAKKAKPVSQIDLALIWNRADIARDEIFTVENRKNWKPGSLDTAMFQALLEGKQEFVLLFIENGVQLNRFLTIKRLHELYRNVMILKDKTMPDIFKNLRHKAKKYDCSFECSRVDTDDDLYLLRDVGKVVNLLLNHEYSCMYAKEKFVVRPGSDEPKDEEHDFYPERELFIWALLFNKVELAELLWKMCTDPIGGALVACWLLKSLAKEATHQEDTHISASLRGQADKYEQMACDILTSCYERNSDDERNKHDAHRLLTRELKSWGKKTLFALAKSAQLMEFMQHDCCHTKLNSIWFGRMVENTHDYKIIMALVCPLLIEQIRFKRERESRTTDSQVNKSFQELNPPERPETKIHRYIAPPITWLCQKTHHAIRALYEFYTSPVTKFYLSMGFYIIYLCLFTIVVSVRMEQMMIDNKFTMQGFMEVILWGWALCFFLEEIRQVIGREAGSLFFKILNHMKNFWNLLDLVIFLLFVVIIVLRLQPQLVLLFVREDTDPYGRIALRKFYAVTLMLSYLRFMETFYASKVIGPKIIMIEQMLKDFILFICILVVFILSFGFAMQSLLYPNMKLSYWLVIEAIYMPFSQVFGELSIDKSDGTIYCTANLTQYGNDDADVQMCADVSWTVRLLFAVYMMLTNVLLMNVLTALFGSTLQAAQKDSEKLLRFYRYQIVYEYFDAPALPAPFIVLVHIKRCVFYFYRRFCDRKKKVYLSSAENQRLSNFEETERDRFLAKRAKMTSGLTDNKSKGTEEKLQQMLEDIHEMKGNLDIIETLLGEADQRNTPSKGMEHNRLRNWRPKSYRWKKRPINRQSSANK